MPLTKTKKIHNGLRKKRRKTLRRWTYKSSREEGRSVFFFYGVKFLKNIIRKEACFRYLFIFNQLKLMYLCFIHIFRYSYYQEETGPISDTSKNNNNNNDDDNDNYNDNNIT